MEALKILVNSDYFPELEKFIKSEITDKVLDIKTDGKSIKRIALEVLASEIANKKILKMLAKMKRLGEKEKKLANSYK